MMKHKMALIKGLSIVILSTSSLIFAGEAKLACPSSELVRQSVDTLDQIWRDDAISPNTYYFEVKSRWHIIKTENALWQLLTYPLASDFNSAFNLAQANIKNVVNLESKDANHDGGREYYCVYLDNTGEYAAMTTTNDNFIYKKQSLNHEHYMFRGKYGVKPE